MQLRWRERSNYQAQSFTLHEERLDYWDLDTADSGKEMKDLWNRNDTLEKELQRMCNINDSDVVKDFIMLKPT